MNTKGNKNTTQPLEWNSAIGLCTRLKNEGQLRDYLLINCGIHFGLRIGDLLTLRFIDLLDKEEFFILEKKTKKQRRITINPLVREGLNHVCQILRRSGSFNPEAFLFSNRWGKPISVSYVNKKLPLIFKRYKIRCTSNESSHILRKTFGRRVWEANDRSDQALIYLSEIFNHGSTATTRMYIGITEENIKDIYIRL